MINLAQLHLIPLIFCLLGFTLLHQVVYSDLVSDLSQDQSSTHYFFFKRIEYGKDCHEVQSQCSASNTSGVYLIKPDGYHTPFEVFCDNSNGSGGWTVIQRRTDGSIDFKRTWTEYQNGFGFLSGEFWIGNNKLSLLTNQNTYELQIEITISMGVSFYLNYYMFRISDDWERHKLTSLGKYSGNADIFCPSNMVYGNCVCQVTCDIPAVCHKNCADGEKTCICPDGYFLNKDTKCVLPQECGCFLEEYGVVPNAGKYANSNCSRGCFCTNNQLTCDDDFRCSTNAKCQVVEDAHQCQCDDRFEGNGQTCTPVPTDCLEVYNAGNTTDGVYTIYPTGWAGSKFDVYCDMTTDGGGWTVFQRRFDGSVDFYQNWTAYKAGFGVKSGEHWLGNDKLYSLTHSKDYQLRVDLVDRHSSGSLGSSVFALYDLFRINDENDMYRLVSLGSFSGTAGYNAMATNLNSSFSTYDRNNSPSRYNAAEKHHGAWWYHNTFRDHNNACINWSEGGFSHYWCTHSNLNGEYSVRRTKNIFWYYHPGNDCNLLRTEMKIRPI